MPGFADSGFCAPEPQRYARPGVNRPRTNPLATTAVPANILNLLLLLSLVSGALAFHGMALPAQSIRMPLRAAVVIAKQSAWHRREQSLERAFVPGFTVRKDPVFRLETLALLSLHELRVDLCDNPLHRPRAPRKLGHSSSDADPFTFAAS